MIHWATNGLLGKRLLFHSFSFLIFFPAVVALYFATPPRWRLWLLLAASYFFYAAWKPEYLLLIMLSTGIDWVVGLRLGTEDRPAARRALLLLSLSVNLGTLFAFKYLNFFAAALSLDWSLRVLLPVGISFYTFQTIGYSIGVGEVTDDFGDMKHVSVGESHVAQTLHVGFVDFTGSHGELHCVPQHRETFL